MMTRYNTKIEDEEDGRERTAEEKIMDVREGR